MQRFYLSSLVLFTLSLCLPLTGCGEKLQGFNGTVTYDGKPLEAGVIIFTPDATKGNLMGASNIASIQNGRYTLPENQGISGGWYEIRVESTEVTQGTGEGAEAVSKDLIPPYVFSHEFKPDDKTFDVDVPKR